MSHPAGMTIQPTSAKKSWYEPRIYFARETGSVLGANFLMGHDVHFDPSNNRLGFAESDCSYSDIVGDDEMGVDDELQN